MQRIEKIKGTINKYDIYKESLEWEKDSKNIEIDCAQWIISDMFAAYIDDNFVSLGLINNHYGINDANSVLLSIRNNPKNTDNLIIDKLLKSMLEYSKEELNAKTAYIELLKSDANSIVKIENNDYDFVNFDDETITFKKILTNKEV